MYSGRIRDSRSLVAVVVARYSDEAAGRYDNGTQYESDEKKGWPEDDKKKWGTKGSWPDYDKKWGRAEYESDEKMGWPDYDKKKDDLTDYDTAEDKMKARATDDEYHNKKKGGTKGSWSDDGKKRGWIDYAGWTAKYEAEDEKMEARAADDEHRGAKPETALEYDMRMAPMYDWGQAVSYDWARDQYKDEQVNGGPRPHGATHYDKRGDDEKRCEWSDDKKRCEKRPRGERGDGDDDAKPCDDNEERREKRPRKERGGRHVRLAHELAAMISKGHIDVDNVTHEQWQYIEWSRHFHGRIWRDARNAVV